MIVSNEMVSKVKRNFGLNMYEARLWLALISKGMSTAGELSELGNVPRSRTYDVLDSLEKKGLISVKRETRPLKYVSIPLETAIENSKSHAKIVATNKKTKLSTIDGEMKILSTLFANSFRETEQTDRIGILKSRENVLHHTSGMIRTAKESLDILLPTAELEDVLGHYEGILKDAKSRGVGITIFTNGKVSPQLSSLVSVKPAKCEQRMLIRDGQESLFMLFPHGEMHQMYDAGIWVTSPYFSGAVSSLLTHSTA